MGRANLLAVVGASPLLAVFALAYTAGWGWWSLGQGLLRFLDFRIIVLWVLPGIALHELIHAIGWAVAGRRPLSSIAVGIRWRSFAPYAHPRDPINARAYRAGALLPGLLLGAVPSVIAVMTGRPMLLIFGLVFTLAAGGDLLVLWLLRAVGGDELVEDHPTRAGCTVLPRAGGQTS